MQVFVRRSDLSRKPEEAMTVMGFYEDATTITPEMGRPEFVILSLPATALEAGPTSMRELRPGWREKYRETIIYGEAERRILATLPAHAQRNVLAEYMSFFAHHGADAAKWPPVAKQRQGEIERGWTYINAVRQAAKGLLHKTPADPTADNLWPKRI
jgi:hypothetical protein